TLTVSGAGHSAVAPDAHVTINGSALAADPDNSGNTALFVGGTTGNDTISITPANPSGTAVNVSINGSPDPGNPFTPTGHIYVFGGDGNDAIQVQSVAGVSVAVPAIIDGGAGNDNVNAQGSQVGNVLLGGAGNDTLMGGLARDLMIGG